MGGLLPALEVNQFLQLHAGINIVKSIAVDS